MTLTVTSDLLARVAGRKTAIQSQIAPIITALAPVADISSDLRMAHFIGQTCHESDGYATLREYASGAAYEGRADLGNTHPGDGKRYPGRGIIETTGRANYRVLTLWCRRGQFPDAPDFEAEPDALQEPRWAVVSALWYWATHHCNAYADKNDVRGLTEVINGGTNGLAQRIVYTQRAIDVLTGPSASTALSGVLRKGDTGAAVKLMQVDLNRAGYKLSVDGDFGPATERAVIAFQKSKGLTADGIVGPVTIHALQAAIQA